MKKTGIYLLIGGLLFGCNIEKKKEGELPEIDVTVSADAGDLPDYEIDWAQVEVGTTTKTVEIPKVVVVMEEEKVEVPFIDVVMPGDVRPKEEQTLMVEAEVSGKAHRIKIKEIWAKGNKLFVISELTELGNDLGKQKMRISDQISLYAPKLDIEHFIVGKRPESAYNFRHRYVKNMDDLEKERDNVRVIYQSQ